MPFVNKCKVAPVKSSIINPVFFAAFFKNHVTESPKQSRNLNFLAVVKVLQWEKAIISVVAVIKSAFLVTVYQIIGGIKIENQFFGRRFV